MLTTIEACKLASQLDGVTTKDHFGSDAYYANKRIFATVWHDKGEVNLKLDLAEQRKFCLAASSVFVEVPNAWGKQGWTTVRLEDVKSKDFKSALTLAWEHSKVGSKSKAKRVTSAKKAKKKAPLK